MEIPRMMLDKTIKIGLVCHIMYDVGAVPEIPLQITIVAKANPKKPPATGPYNKAPITMTGRARFIGITPGQTNVISDCTTTITAANIATPVNFIV